jgi:acyl-CoA thioesterase
VIFSLADAAFSAACNSQGIPAVALSMTINYVQAPPPGTQLVAEASAVRQGRRAGFYNVVVSDSAGRLVATVHCVAYRREPGSAAAVTAPAARPIPSGSSSPERGSCSRQS